MGWQFWQSTIKLHYHLRPSILAKHQDDQRSTTISSIQWLNFKFLRS